LPVTVTTDRIGCPVTVALGGSPTALRVLQVLDRWHTWNGNDPAGASAYRDVWIVETSAGCFALHHLHTLTPKAPPHEEIFSSDPENASIERYWQLLAAPLL